MINPLWFKMTGKEREIINLEEKYMTSLLKIFKTNIFSNKLKELLKNFNQDDLITYSSSPLAIPFERLIHYYIHREFKEKIISPYVSPISGDVAVVLDDCVLSIDAKTISKPSNPNDMTQLNCSGNQFSFKNKILTTLSGVWECKSKLSERFNDKPVLSYFLILNYTHKAQKDFRNLELFSHELSKNITLVSVPNGIISKYFSKDLIYGYKNYDKLNDKRIKHHKLCNEILLPKQDFSKLDLQQTKKILQSYVDKNFFKEVTPQKCDNGTYNFICNRTNYTYRLRPQDNNVSFGPEEASGTVRIKFIKDDIKSKKDKKSKKAKKKPTGQGLFHRFDDEGNAWKGCVHWDLI